MLPTLPNKRVWLAMIPILLIVALLWWATSRRAPASLPAAPPAGEAMVTRGDLAATVQATGRVEAERRARLSLPMGGTVASVLVEVGDAVAAGEPLLALDPQEVALRVREAEAALRAAQAQQAKAESPASPGEVEAAQAQLRAARLALSVAEATLDEVAAEEQASSEEAVKVEEARAGLEGAEAALRRLVDGPTVEERAALVAQVEQAQVRVAQAQAALAGTTLRAPFDGTVVERLVSAGERVNPTQPLLSVADLNTMVVAAEVDEVDVGRVEAGQMVTVTLDAFPARPLTGEVQRIAPAAGEPRGATSYRTIIHFDPEGVPARLDMAADVQVRTANATDVLLLPLSAIRYAETQPFVLVRRGGQPTEQEVTLGAQDERQVEIVAGLAEGEVVIVP